MLTDPLLSVAEVQQLIPGVSEQTLRHWRFQGIGPEAVRLGRRVYYRLSGVEAWIADQERQQRAGRAARIERTRAR